MSNDRADETVVLVCWLPMVEKGTLRYARWDEYRIGAMIAERVGVVDDKREQKLVELARVRSI